MESWVSIFEASGGSGELGNGWEGYFFMGCLSQSEHAGKNKHLSIVGFSKVRVRRLVAAGFVLFEGMMALQSPPDAGDPGSLCGLGSDHRR